jgi:hypothetical protein
LIVLIAHVHQTPSEDGVRETNRTASFF